jgi:hypothetical protein
LITGVSESKSERVTRGRFGYYISAGAVHQTEGDRYYTCVSKQSKDTIEIGESIRYESSEEMLEDFGRVVQKYKDLPEE